MNGLCAATLITAVCASISGCLFLDGGDSAIEARLRSTEDLYEPVFEVADWPWSHVDIATELANTGDVDLVLTGCYKPWKPWLYKSVDDDWVRIPYGYAIGPPCRFEPLHIKPGEVNLDTLRMGARFDPEGAPEPMWTEVISVTGLYRLEQQVYLIDLFGDRPDSLLPSLDLVSQEFEIRPRYNSPLQMQRARQDPEAR